PGAKLGTIENEARKVGYELRCYPSTWVKASIGGFVGGGSGGIGSITYGGIRDADNVKSLTLLTVEAEPKLIRLEECDTIKAQHTYGTTGIMVELEMRLGVKRSWDQLAFSSTSFDALLDFTANVATDDQIPKRLVTLHEWPIPSYFKPLKKWLPADQHVTFLEIESGAASDAVTAKAAAAGISMCHFIPAHEPRRSPMLSDYTWNHTTLWAIKQDPTLTYLQSGFGENYREKFKLLRAKFPDEIYFHLEFVKGNAKMGERFSAAGCGGIPIVRFKGAKRLQELIDYCTEIGVFTANPHTYFLEEGGRHPEIASKRALKAEADPRALLNPGKMKTYPINPFAKEPASV
ncbi:MAG TPA: FAD-binding protein, partial [Opitutaceae bacterium]|nr:FAD-binding protein [Opitutaceae bacterium]